MIGFALAAAALALLVLLAVVLPLLRGGAAGPDRAAFDRAVYRDQLDELGRDAARGMIGPDEAAAARLEIQRRLLGRAGPEGPAARRGRSPALAVVLVLLAGSGAALLYLATGAPDLPSLPFAQRPVDAEAARMQAAVAALERRVAAAPGDGGAWLQLAQLHAEAGQWRAAEVAYRRVLALVPPSPELRAAALEAGVLAADGIVGEAAATGLAGVLAEAPDNIIARFYLALADAQAGRHQAAIAAWQALAGDLPESAGIRAEIARRIAATASAAGIPVPPLPPPAAAPSPEARAAMIRGMVERLAARLAETPDDADGWQRLGRAYAVMGERAKSAEAYARAGALRPDDMAIALAEAQALLEGLPPSAAVPPRALELLTRVLAADPRQPAALWHLGVAAAKRGAMDEAVGYWNRLIAVLPEGGDDARMVRGAIAAVRR
ncbi:MAG: c-type cytochrome biogenesis protein CcmI [Acetobacteraceae bacterium]|nr:c-type cytochrome biogenesis protein CcmI [Acetobacteraceae bacterium]